MANKVDILEVGNHRAELIEAAEGENGVLNILIKGACRQLSAAKTTARHQAQIKRTLWFQIGVKALRVDLAGNIVQAALEQFADGGKAGGCSNRKLHQCALNNFGLDGGFGAKGFIGPLQIAVLQTSSTRLAGDQAIKGPPMIISTTHCQHHRISQVDGIFKPNPK